MNWRIYALLLHIVGATDPEYLSTEPAVPADNSAKQSRISYEDLFRSLPSAIIVVKPNMIIADANNMYLEITGFSKDIIGRSITDVADELKGEEEGAQCLITTFKTVIKNKVKESYDFIDKYKRSWHTEVYPVFVPVGSQTMVFMQCQVTDTTKLKKEQQRNANILEQLHDVNNYRRLVNAVRHYAIFIVDTGRRITHWNQGGVTLTGWKEQEAVGKSIFDLYDETAAEAVAKRLETIGSEIDHGINTNFKRSDGSYFVADTTITRITKHRQEQTTIGFAFAVRDLTQTINNENNLREVYEQAAIMKDDFTSRCSHDIRTPLNAISLATDALFATLLTSEQNDLVFLIERSTKRQLVHVNEILDFSKLTAHNRRLSLHLESTDLAEFLTVEINDYKLITPNEITVRTHFSPLLSNYLTDQTKIQQIVQNLMSNALKFTARGLIALTVTVDETKDPQVDNVTFSFEDTGKGVSATDIPTLFTPYTQIDGSNTQRNRGSGLGLSIVKIVAETMGGTVVMKSEGLQKGTTVLVTLPLRRCTRSRPVLQKSATTPRAIGDGMQPILVAEDDEVNRNLLVRGLTRLGYNRVDQAVNGQELLRMASPGHPYRLIISDVQMPIMSGIEATIQIRSYDTTTPIIALTADGMEANINRCQAAGMNTFLIKPIRIKNLSAHIAAFLKNSEES